MLIILFEKVHVSTTPFLPIQYIAAPYCIIRSDKMYPLLNSIFFKVTSSPVIFKIELLPAPSILCPLPIIVIDLSIEIGFSPSLKT